MRGCIFTAKSLFFHYCHSGLDPESSIFKEVQETWTPFFNGVTDFSKQSTSEPLRLKPLIFRTHSGSHKDLSCETIGCMAFGVKTRLPLLIPEEVVIGPKILNEMFETCYKGLFPLVLTLPQATARRPEGFREALCCGRRGQIRRQEYRRGDKEIETTGKGAGY